MSGLSGSGSNDAGEPPNLYLHALYVVLRDLALAKDPGREPSEAELRQMLMDVLTRARTEWREECARARSSDGR